MPIIAIKPLKRSAPEFMIFLEKTNFNHCVECSRAEYRTIINQSKDGKNTELRILQLVSYCNGFFDRCDSSIKGLTLVVF